MSFKCCPISASHIYALSKTLFMTDCRLCGFRFNSLISFLMFDIGDILKKESMLTNPKTLQELKEIATLCYILPMTNALGNFDTRWMPNTCDLVSHSTLSERVRQKSRLILR